MINKGISGELTIHVCSASEDNIPGFAMKENPITRDHLKFCRGLRKGKIVPKGLMSQGDSVPKVMKRVAEHCKAATFVVGSDPEIDLRDWLSLARHCGNRSAASSIVLAVHKGKVIFKRRSIWRPRGFKLEQRPQVNFCEIAKSGTSKKASRDDSWSSRNVSRNDSRNSEYENSSVQSDNMEKPLVHSISILRRELPELTLGWPLRKTTPSSQETHRKSEDTDTDVSVVQWVMSLPRRSNLTYQQNLVDLNDSFSGEIGNSVAEKLEIEGSKHSVIQSSTEESVARSWNLNDESCSLVDEDSLISVSTILEELPQSAQGCPPFGVAASQTQDSMKDSYSECKDEASSISVSTIFDELPQSAKGWPLLRIGASQTLDSTDESETIHMSADQQEMNQPNRSAAITQQSPRDLSSNTSEDSPDRNISCPWIRNNDKCSTPPRKLSNTLELLLERSSACRWFSYEELNRATSKFCPANMIGEGGCSNVYKGVLPNGKLVAVKMLKSYKEAWNDFSLEISILSSSTHKHITPLIGVCIEDNYLISVYKYFHKGSLEENLHGEKSMLTWDARFNVAVKVAEALNYLHNECPRPVIHRDVKSANILLSNKFQPQLSDFGLAIWGPTDSAYLIDNDVAGTFGYIAPEYFMHGRVSDKIDAYSYGVVLLELLSGKRPIAPKAPNGQESLVKWAKPLLETSDLKELIDSKLNGDFDVVQVQRMVLAANLCINQSARFRPSMSQILKLLGGEEDAIAKSNDLEGSENQGEDDLFSEFECQPHLSVALLHFDDDSSGTAPTTVGITSPRIREKRRHQLKDYLKVPH